MNVLQKQIGRHQMGIWVTLFALLLTFLAWMMQLYSLFNWEGAIGLGTNRKTFQN